MFKIGDVIEGTFVNYVNYKDDDEYDDYINDQKNLFKKIVIVVEVSEKHFRCFSDDGESTNTYLCLYDEVNKETYDKYYKKIGELSKEDYNIKYNKFNQRKNN